MEQSLHSSNERDSGMTSAMTTSASGGGEGGGSGSSSTRRYIVFDGSTDFNVWRARLENELLRFHLLGYIFVKDYDGSQSFLYNNEEIPPKCAMVVDEDARDDEQDHAGGNNSNSTVNGSNGSGVFIKDEPVQQQRQDGNGNVTGRKRMRGAPSMRPGRLSRLEVISERAEAMSILQRYLHPEVERAILGKNIYDSWITLCGMYGNRNVSDFYTVHRLLHAMKLGEKKEESAQDFIVRLELMMEQYAQIAGIQLTDPFRSMVLANALPASWTPLLGVWKAFKPYIPYVQLVEKVTFEFNSQLVLKERELAMAQKTPMLENETSPKPISHARSKSPLAVDTTPAAKEVSAVPAASPSKPPSSTSPVSTQSSRAVQDKPKASSRAEDKHEDKSDYKAKGKVDEKRSDKQSSSSHHEKRDDKRDDKRVDKHDGAKRVEENGYAKKREETREFKREDRRENDRGDDRRDYKTNRDEKRNTCYYCLKFGHVFQQCWFLRVDIESGSYVNSHKKYSATVTHERTAYMVHRIEQYAREARQDRGSKTIAEIASSTTPRSYADRSSMRSTSSFREDHTFSYSRSDHGGDSRGMEPPSRSYMSYGESQESRAAEPPKTPSRSYSEIASMRSKSMYRESAPQQQSYGYVQPSESRLESDVDRYKKRSHSVYGADSEQIEKSRPRDPRSRSVFRQPEAPVSQDLHSRSAFRSLEPAANRRSVSPIPNNAHRVCSQDPGRY